MTVTGGLAWWNDFVVVACYNVIDQQEQVGQVTHKNGFFVFIAIRINLLISIWLILVEALPADFEPGQCVCFSHKATL